MDHFPGKFKTNKKDRNNFLKNTRKFPVTYLLKIPVKKQHCSKNLSAQIMCIILWLQRKTFFICGQTKKYCL